MVRIISVFCIFILHLAGATLLGPIGNLIIGPRPTSMFSGLEYGSYYKGPVCYPSEKVRHPKSVIEIVRIVREAIYRGKTVKAIGLQHSATDIICTDGIPISMLEIGGMKMNSDNSVTVGAGVNLYTLTKFLKENGRGLKTIPAFGNITLGGAIGTGAHGSSIKHKSSISEQVIGVEIVDGTGSLRHINSPTELLAFRVHLGLLGIITKATLMTEPLYKVRGHNYPTSDEILLNGKVIDIARQSDQVSIYWFPSFHKVVIANWTFLPDLNTPGTAKTYDHTPSTYDSFNILASDAVELVQAADSTAVLNVLQAYLMRSLYEFTPDFVPIYTEDGFHLKNPAVGFYDDMLSPICDNKGSLQCPWFHGPYNITLLDNEISINLKDLPAFAARLKYITQKYPAAFIMQGILLRFSAPTNTYMSESQGDHEAVHFEFYTYTRKDPYETASSGLAAFQAILQTLAFDFKGKSHWGKTGNIYHSTEFINMKLDPIAKQNFIGKMHQYDPNGIFMNDFGRRLLGVGTKINIDPKTTHCALLDNCICSSDHHCAPRQTCGYIDEHPKFPVCLTPGHSLNTLNKDPVLTLSLAEYFLGILSGLILAVSS